MAPKQRTPAASPAPPSSRSTKPNPNNTSAAAITQGIWDKYVNKTPQRTKLLDVFLAFLIVVGALQFAYVVLVGNFVRISPIKHMHTHRERIRERKRLTEQLVPYSHSTPSSLDSAQQSANSCSRPRYASRQTRRTRSTLKTFRTNALLQTSSLGAYCCTFSASTLSTKGAMGSETRHGRKARYGIRL
jgi:hypothetical protein